MKINKLKKLPNGKYKIYLSNNEEITTYDDVILKHNLLFNKELDNDLLNEIEIDNGYYTLYNKCVNYISKRLRSEKEIKEYLLKYTTNDDDINNIIKQLKEVGLINDYNFASSFVSDKVFLSNMGPLKIENELIDHNIDTNIIREKIDSIDQEVLKDKINKYISKKVKSNHKYSSFILKQKIVSDLINLGYSKDLIYSILDNYTIDSNIDKEFDKQYHKLSTKYSDEELYYQLKNKLYQKGYSSDEIEEIIKRVNI